MDLRVLKAFITVCRLGNITKASKALYISQPALTRQIQDLETELGCKLLNRSTRSLSLTEDGYLLLLRAQEIIDLANQVKRELSEKGNDLRGLIRIGVVESSVIKPLANAITQFKKDFPHVSFDIYSADGDDLKRALDENKLDIAFLIEPVESAKYERIPLDVKERWGLVVRKEDYPEKTHEISLTEVAQHPLIVPRRYIVLSEISSWFGVPEDKLNIFSFHNLLSNALPFVENGSAVSLCIEGAFSNRPVPALRFLPLVPERTSFHVATRKKNRKLSKPCELFWNAIEKYFPLTSVKISS